MFFRYTKDFSFYLKRQGYKYLVNENNMRYLPKFVIFGLGKMMSAENFRNFRYWIFKRWILKNFAYTQEFIRRFHKYRRKLKLILNSQEEEFIYNVEEVNFALWRPLKVLPIYYDLLPKEKCHFKNNNVNLHTFESNNKVNFLCKGTLLITNQRIILDGVGNNQGDPETVIFPLNTIQNVEFIDVGVKFTAGGVTYLMRHSNNVLIGALFYRALGKRYVSFDLRKLPLSLTLIPHKGEHKK